MTYTVTTFLIKLFVLLVVIILSYGSVYLASIVALYRLATESYYNDSLF